MSENEKGIREISEELERLKCELAEANRKLEVCARTDAMTGVCNRLVFESVLKAEWQRCRRYLIPLSLILVDLDSFAAFNGQYGQKTGDDCLKRVAGALNSCARRSSDTVSRYSGDEFAILVPHLQKDYAFVLAGIIRDKITSLSIPHEKSPVSKYLTASIGIHTAVPDDQLFIQDYIRVAEIALIEAKKEHNSIIME